MWQGAYYLAGYSIECALKACIAKQVEAESWPDLQLAKAAWVHDLGKLRKVAGLERQMEEAFGVRERLSIHWATAKDWAEDSRYRSDVTEVQATDLIQAIADGKDGILPWLRERW